MKWWNRLWNFAQAIGSQPELYIGGVLGETWGPRAHSRKAWWQRNSGARRRPSCVHPYVHRGPCLAPSTALADKRPRNTPSPTPTTSCPQFNSTIYQLERVGKWTPFPSTKKRTTGRLKRKCLPKKERKKEKKTRPPINYIELENRTTIFKCNIYFWAFLTLLTSFDSEFFNKTIFSLITFLFICFFFNSQ